MKPFFQLLLALCVITLQSCIVTKKKYDDMLAQKVRIEGDLVQKSDQLDKAQSKLNELDQQLNKLKEDTTSLGDQKRSAARKLAELNTEYEQLGAYYKNLLNNSGKLNRDLAQNKEQLLAIQDNLDRTRRVNDSLGTSLAEREKKVRELETILANKDKAVQDIRNRVSAALLNFKENDLTVNVKNGKVYVSLAEQLLFGSGSIEVDAKGVTALQQLAKAIKDQKDIQIMVEGHTDNVPIGKKSQYMQDNWDLSVMRATSITKILTKAGVAAGQITASGKGEFSPLAANSTDINKQKNRRTEIIITPDLDELFKILGTN
jgi:chemotaxis protein MotB